MAQLAGEQVHSRPLLEAPQKIALYSVERSRRGLDRRCEPPVGRIERCFCSHQSFTAEFWFHFFEAPGFGIFGR